jgi:TP901 family phage tail tape measure protein
MSTLGSINVKIGADTAGLVAGTNRARDAMGRFIPLAQQAGGAVGGVGQRAREAAGAVRKFGDAGRESTGSLSGLVQQLAGAAAGILTVKTAADAAWGAIRGVVETTAKFDQSMAKVSAVTGIVGNDFATLRQSAIDLGASSVYSASQVAEGFATLGAAGISDVNQMMAAMPGILDMAAASGADFAQSTEIAVGAMNAFHLQAQDVTHISDVLAAGAAASAVSISDLGNSLKYVGPVAAASGMSLEEVVAGLTAMGQANIKSENAGTAMRAMLVSLNDPSSEAARRMKDLSIEAFDQAGHMLSLAQVTGAFQERLKGLSEQQRNAALSTIFGREALAGSLAVINQGVDGIERLATGFGRVDDQGKLMAARMTDSLLGSVEMLNGAMESLSITLGTPVTGEMNEVVKSVTNLVGELNGLAQVTVPMVSKALDDLTGGTLSVAIDGLAEMLRMAKMGALVLSMLGISGTYNALMNPRDENGNPLKKAGGGLLSGPGSGTSDSIPAWLSNGEFVVNAASTRKFLPALQMMNAGKFADGGMPGYGATASPDDYAMLGLAGYGSPAALALDASTRSLAIAVAQNARSMAASQTAIAAHAASVSEVTLTLDDASSVVQTAANSFSGVGADIDAVAADITDMADSIDLSTELWTDAATAEAAWTDAAWATAAECENASAGVRTFADSAQLAAQASADAAEAARVSAELFGTTGDRMKDIGYGFGTGQRKGDLSVHSLDGMTLKLEYFANTFPEKMKAVLGSFSANIADMFPTLKGAQKMWEQMNQGDLWAQGLNPFLDFGALKSMQEGNLNLLRFMEKGTTGAYEEQLQSLIGTTADWTASLQENRTVMGMATEGQYAAAAATQAMSDSLIQASTTASMGLQAAGEGALASAAATSGAAEWVANSYLASGQIVNHAATSMATGFIAAASGVLGAASAAVSAVGASVAQLGMGDGGLSELERQMQSAGTTGAVATSTGTTGGNMGIATGSQWMIGPDGRKHRVGLSGGYGAIPPIVLVLDGQQIYASVQGHSNYYGAANVSGGIG